MLVVDTDVLGVSALHDERCGRASRACGDQNAQELLIVVFVVKYAPGIQAINSIYHIATTTNQLLAG